MDRHRRIADCEVPTDCGYLVGEEVGQEWDVFIIVLSVLVAICGAFTSLMITGFLRHCASRAWSHVFTLVAGVGLGVNTVWCTHFVGMDALLLSGGKKSGAQAILRIEFDACCTIISGLAAMVIATLGLHLARPGFGRKCVGNRQMLIRLSGSALLIAAGVCAMHYLGMVSQTGYFRMEYDPAVVVASTVIAAAASGAGLYLLLVIKHSLLSHLGSAMVIAGAVSGMHYTGMRAARYTVMADSSVVTTDTTWRIDGQNVAIGALVFDLVLYYICNFYGDRQRREYEIMQRTVDAKREQELQRTVNEAVASVDELPHPLVTLPSRYFLELNREDMWDDLHEKCRESGMLQVFDTMALVREAKMDGAFIIFFSYECLGLKVGPDENQLSAMKRACYELAAGAGKNLEDVYIWLDCLSIPQRNKAMQAAAITSIYTFASVPDAMVLICPESEHVLTGRPANVESMKSRMWCRVEHLSYCCSRGRRSMYLHRGVSLEVLPDDWMPSVCCVFEANTTCCSKKHFLSPRCDRESVVMPLLALYYDVYKRQHKQFEKEKDQYAWDLIMKYREGMFPRTYIYCNSEGEEERPLFDDMLERVENLVKDNKLKVFASVSDTVMGDILSDPIFEEGWTYTPEAPSNSCDVRDATISV